MALSIRARSLSAARWTLRPSRRNEAYAWNVLRGLRPAGHGLRVQQASNRGVGRNPRHPTDRERTKASHQHCLQHVVWKLVSADVDAVEAHHAVDERHATPGIYSACLPVGSAVGWVC